MITAKFYKKIPKRLINQCPDVMVGHTTDANRVSDEEINWFSFVNENGEEVGCINLGWDCLNYINGFPQWTVYVYLFEVCKKFRGKGFAKEMVQWLENLPQVNEIQLSHCSVGSDYGSSRSWWMHMGWKYLNKHDNRMYKKIK